MRTLNRQVRPRLGLVGVLWIGLLASFIGQPASCEDNVLGFDPEALSTGGTLMIHGGGDMSDEILREFIELAGGRNAKIVVIPTAFPFETREEMEECYGDWREIETRGDVRSVVFLDTDSSEEADADDFAEPLRDATAVWICGGAQGRLADIYGTTQVAKEIRQVLARGGLVGGTSAGASIMSKVMIRYGSRTEAFVGEGFGLLSRAVIDQHFLYRRREKRLANVINEHRGHIGLGIDEGTCAIIRGNELRVMGNSKVVVCMAETDEQNEWKVSLDDGDRVRFMLIRESEEGQLLKVDLMQAGSGDMQVSLTQQRDVGD